MRNIKWMGILPILALILAACAPSVTETSPAVTPIATEATETGAIVTETAEPLATETTAAETAIPESTAGATTGATAGATTEATSIATTPAVGTQTAGVPVTGSATVNVTSNASYGPILVNGEGLSLYVFMSDALKDGTSACTGNCAIVWPPLASEGEPTAGTGIDPAMLGTITRDDGTTQVTYNGWPLYLYHADGRPGDTNGQGVSDSGGRWYLLSPDGEPVEF